MREKLENMKTWKFLVEFRSIVRIPDTPNMESFEKIANSWEALTIAARLSILVVCGDSIYKPVIPSTFKTFTSICMKVKPLTILTTCLQDFFGTFWIFLIYPVPWKYFLFDHQEVQFLRILFHSCSQKQQASKIKKITGKN